MEIARPSRYSARVSKPLRLEEQVLYVYAALQHLKHDRSTVDIGEELGVSRFMVGRMVKRARDDGLIEVRPRLSDPIDAELSRALAERFGLHSAIAAVTPSDNPDHVRSVIATVAAKLVKELIVEDDIVGLGPGRTIVEMCAKITDIPMCDVVQLTGVATSEAEESLRAVMTLSSIARGRMFPMHAPLVATDAAAARAISAQPAIKQALHRMDRLHKAVLTIGGWPTSSLLAEQVRQLGELPRLQREGVVAEIGTTLLDANGREVHALEGQIIGISTEQLARVPVTIAIGGGAGKEQAVLAALRSGFVDILVTDVQTARAAIASAD